MKKKNTYNLPFVIFVIFLLLKLTNNIDWSWYWVTSPLWLPIAFILSISLVFISIFVLLIFFGFKLEDIQSKIEKYKNK